MQHQKQHSTDTAYETQNSESESEARLNTTRNGKKKVQN